MVLLFLFMVCIVSSARCVEVNFESVRQLPEFVDESKIVFLETKVRKLNRTIFGLTVEIEFKVDLDDKLKVNSYTMHFLLVADILQRFPLMCLIVPGEIISI